jgi:DNA-binding NtrC family response regulator
LRKFSPDDDISIDRQALEILISYRWPGNVRELENLVKRLTIFKAGKKIKPGHLPLEILKPDQEAKTLHRDHNNHSALSSSEIKLITEALNSTGWNQSKAAARLGIPRHVLIYRMKKYDIREE